jgi:hypothetical protein
MTAIFQFGEDHADYPVRVLNEREARAGAGILLFFGMIAFLTAFLTGDFTLTRIAILVFGFDFVIRVLVNPRFAPSLVIGRFMVRKQKPEYVGAPQKRFAWSLGLLIAIAMTVWVIGLNHAGPVAILGCLTCLILLFFETAFGICIGCVIFQALWPEKAKLCPGGTCELGTREPITFIRPIEATPALILAAGLVMTVPVIAAMPQPSMPGRTLASGEKDCTIPEFAKRIGHEEMWKRHNGC